MTENQHDAAVRLTPEAFAVLGGGELAYVKSVRSEDVKAMFPQAPELAPGIKLFFGTQKYPTPTAKLGETRTNKKTNFFNKTDQEGCNWVFLSAARSLQEYARKMGGNAVVNIVSFYKSREFVSETQFECGAGSFVGGVALRGEVVLIK